MQMTENNFKVHVKKVQDLMNNMPLEEILDIATTVVLVFPIPGLPLIIKVIKLMVKAKPVANGLISALSGTKRSAEAKQTFQDLLEIALEDGVISSSEEEFLRPRAYAAGYSSEEFEEVISKYKRG